MQVRPAQDSDQPSIHGIVATAFPAQERAIIGQLVDDLAVESTHPPVKALVAEVAKQVVGYVCYSPVFCTPSTGISGYILAPLGVLPHHQKQGIGSRLIRDGIAMLSDDGVDVVLVYGDPRYYGHMGFEREIGQLFVPPYALQYPFGWLGMHVSGCDLPQTPLACICVQALSKPDLW